MVWSSLHVLLPRIVHLNSLAQPLVAESLAHTPSVCAFRRHLTWSVRAPYRHLTSSSPALHLINLHPPAGAGRRRFAHCSGTRRGVTPHAGAEPSQVSAHGCGTQRDIHLKPRPRDARFTHGNGPNRAIPSRSRSRNATLPTRPRPATRRPAQCRDRATRTSTHGRDTQRENPPTAAARNAKHQPWPGPTRAQPYPPRARQRAHNHHLVPAVSGCPGKSGQKLSKRAFVNASASSFCSTQPNTT